MDPVGVLVARNTPILGSLIGPLVLRSLIGALGWSLVRRPWIGPLGRTIVRRSLIGPLRRTLVRRSLVRRSLVGPLRRSLIRPLRWPLVRGSFVRWGAWICHGGLPFMVSGCLSRQQDVL